MIIEVDVGNSRVKWRISRNGLADATCFQTHLDMEESKSRTVAQWRGAERIRVSSVADSFTPLLLEMATELGANIEFARSQALSCGVTNSYAQPETMGVDRWLAMIAAFNAVKRQRLAVQPPCVVIDSGTSLTIDAVAGSGQHLGGLILPGKRLLLDSLARRTEKVLFNPAISDGQLLLGCSTQDAVLNGSVHMMVGAVQQAIQSAGLAAKDCCFFLCGGDAALLKRYLTVEAEVVPDLVLDGLQYSLP